jgi:hypothetical protein
MLSLLLISACTSGKESATNTEDSSTNQDSSQHSESPVAPEVEKVETADCTTSADDIDIWSITVKVYDPQDDVSSADSTLEVIKNDKTLATYALACNGESCVGSWRSTDDNIDCSVGESSIFRIIIRDKAGNESEPFDYKPE